MAVPRQAEPVTGLRGLMLLDDYASARTAAATTDFLATSGVKMVPHPPYSSNLSPCDWFLFANVKDSRNIYWYS